MIQASEPLHDMADLLEHADTKLYAHDLDDLWNALGNNDVYTVVRDDEELLEETYAVEADSDLKGSLAVPAWENEYDARQFANQEGEEYGVMELSSGEFNYKG